MGNCPVTARTLQGMARVRSGQAPARPLVADRSVRRGSGVKRDFACTFTRHFHRCSLPCGHGKIGAEDPAAAMGRASNDSSITAPDLGRFFCVREEFKNSKVDMGLSEPLRASAQHIELLQH